MEDQLSYICLVLFFCVFCVGQIESMRNLSTVTNGGNRPGDWGSAAYQ